MQLVKAPHDRKVGFRHRARQVIDATPANVQRPRNKDEKLIHQLEIKKMKEIDKWLEQFRKIWEDRFNQLDKVLSKLKPNKK